MGYKIALDIDDTLYDTRGVEEKVNKRVQALYNEAYKKGNVKNVRERVDELYNDINTYFDKREINEGVKEALEGFKAKYPDTEFYIITARNVYSINDTDKELYMKLLEDINIGITSDKIYERNSFYSKAELCRKLGIDLLVDDNDRGNFTSHLTQLDMFPEEYKTVYVWYAGAEIKRTGLERCLRDLSRYSQTETLKYWKDFIKLAENILIKRKKGADMREQYVTSNAGHKFLVVDKIPKGYIVWNIGNNMQEGYVPICMLTDNVSSKIIPGTLKAVRSEGAAIILEAVGRGQNTLAKMEAYVKRYSKSKSRAVQVNISRLRKAIPYMKQIVE